MLIAVFGEKAEIQKDLSAFSFRRLSGPWPFSSPPALVQDLQSA
jgi:hypothetical protein